MTQILPFHKKYQPLEVDWEAVEEERKNKLPRIPKKALLIIRKNIESLHKKTSAGQDESRIDIPDNGDPYSRAPILLSPRKSDILWLLDLYDRYGGCLSDGKQICTIRRTKKRLPVFIIQEVSQETYQGLDEAFGSLYEVFCRSDKWTILGKDFQDIDLMGILIDHFDLQRFYYGLFDKQTAHLLIDRVKEGVPIDKAFLLDF